MSRAHQIPLLALLLAPLAIAQTVRAQPWADDPDLRAVHASALAHDPTLQALSHRVTAEMARAPLSTALPDPTLMLGYQNDGFTSLPLGTMPTTYISVQASQTLPYPGKRAARESVAVAGVQVAQAQMARRERVLRAQIDRAWLAWLVARAQLRVLEAQDALWASAVTLARARVQAGQPVATDVVRAQLQQARLTQLRTRQRGAAAQAVRTLNRLAQRPLDAELTVTHELEALPLPEVTTAEAASWQVAHPALIAADAQSTVTRARRALVAAERQPDFLLAAGVMPRGALEPMWMLQVGMTLPFLRPSKRDAAVADVEARARADEALRSAAVQSIAAQTTQGLAQLTVQRGLVETQRTLVLPQSRLAVDAALRAYGAGQTSLVPVFDAVTAWLADRQMDVTLLAEWHAQRIALEAGDDLPALPVLPDLVADPGDAAAMPAGGM